MTNKTVNDVETEIITTQILGSFGFLISAIISIIVSLELYYEKKTGVPLFPNNEGEQLETFNKLLLLTIVVVLFFNSLRTLQLEIDSDGEVDNAKLGSLIAFITLIGAALSVYSIKFSNDELNITDIEDFIL